jgi:FAD/FMN-containing dehydrogenase
MREFLISLLGRDRVLVDPEALAPYREDFTEADPRDPSAVAFATTTEEVQAIVREAGRTRTPLTARVAGTNVGGLAIPAQGGVVLDLSRMDRVLAVHEEDMVAVIEPGVTQIGLKEHLARAGLPLTFGFSLAPPDTSVLANALLGGLTNRSLKYGDQADWISGLEVVLADGSLARTGAWSLVDLPFGRVPFPDLTGLFVAWQGTTGIATKMAFQLWPLHPCTRRLFVLAYSARGTFEAMRRLCRLEICDDIGGLSWVSGRMILGVKRPDPAIAPGEPAFFLYIDLTGEDEEELALKERLLTRCVRAVAATGERFEDPLDVPTLVKLSPPMSKFAEFPTELDFLTKHGGGGLTWMGTYGPLSRFVEAAEAGMAAMVARGFPPLVVSRAMRGGHFGVLRFISIFDKADAAEVARVRELNAELLELVTARGFIMYKTPIWAWERLRPRLDPGAVELMRRVRKMMDPEGILNPDKLPLR